MSNIEDWLVVCTPKSLTSVPLQQRPWGVQAMASSDCAALRQWVAEINRLCHDSKLGPVDWRDFQDRLKPMLLELLQDATVEYKHVPGQN